ncbi:hypothetical protein O181_070464 [Austropuccinia psidii MF-1]|uniref:Uncharacterized protein n=1 Tax=Austropuccinia psidii MF-1 TaxID=1389203 RepID=A0A9Q3F1A7_9BASI|nr:hypothetical protein [Austropuccinia psidii MF-1]
MKWKIPGLNISRIESMDVLSEEGLRGNLANKYLEEIFPFDEQARKALYDYIILPQEDLNLHNMEPLGGRLYWEECGYLFIHKEEGLIKNWKGETSEERKKGRNLLGKTAKVI